MARRGNGSLRRNIRQTLVGDTRITRLLGGARIFANAPDDAAYPYVTLGESVATDWDAPDGTASDHVVTLHVWSRAGGTDETRAIIGAVRNALNDAPLELPDRSNVSLRHEFSEARRDPVNEAYHGFIRYRAVPDAA